MANIFTRLWQQIRGTAYPPTEQRDMLLPNTPHKTASYLFNDGFFGSGADADETLGKALNLTAMVQAYAFHGEGSHTPQDRKDETQLLQTFIRQMGEDMASPNIQRLVGIVKHGPDLNTAHESTQKIGLLDRVIQYIPIPFIQKRGKVHQAAEQWADSVAAWHIHKLLRDIRDVIDSMDVPRLADGSYDLSNEQGQMVLHQAAQVPEIAGRVHAATYTLDNPGMLVPLVREQRDVLLDAKSLTEKANHGKAPEAERSYLSFGEVAAIGGFLKDQNGASLPYTEARAIADTALLHKSTNRMRHITDAFTQMDEQPLTRLALDTPGERQQALETLLTFAGTMMQLSRPLQALPKHWETDIRRDQQAASPLYDALTAERQARYMLSGHTYGLANASLQMAQQLQQYDAMTPEQRDVLHQSLERFADAVAKTREEARSLTTAGLMITETALQNASAMPALQDNAKLAQHINGLERHLLLYGTDREYPLRGDLNAITPHLRQQNQQLTDIYTQYHSQQAVSQLDANVREIISKTNGHSAPDAATITPTAEQEHAHASQTEQHAAEPAKDEHLTEATRETAEAQSKVAVGAAS